MKTRTRAQIVLDDVVKVFTIGAGLLALASANAHAQPNVPGLSQAAQELTRLLRSSLPQASGIGRSVVDCQPEDPNRDFLLPGDLSLITVTPPHFKDTGGIEDDRSQSVTGAQGNVIGRTIKDFRIVAPFQTPAPQREMLSLELEGTLTMSTGSFAGGQTLTTLRECDYRIYSASQEEIAELSGAAAPRNTRTPRGDRQALSSARRPGADRARPGGLPANVTQGGQWAGSNHINHVTGPNRQTYNQFTRGNGYPPYQPNQQAARGNQAPQGTAGSILGNAQNQLRDGVQESVRGLGQSVDGLVAEIPLIGDLLYPNSGDDSQEALMEKREAEIKKAVTDQQNANNRSSSAEQHDDSLFGNIFAAVIPALIGSLF